ncbi:MAG: hypothetical protein R3F34_05940 [Planctomycetota bacterium]
MHGTSAELYSAALGVEPPERSQSLRIAANAELDLEGPDRVRGAAHLAESIGRTDGAESSWLQLAAVDAVLTPTATGTDVEVDSHGLALEAQRDARGRVVVAGFAIGGGASDAEDGSPDSDGAHDGSTDAAGSTDTASASAGAPSPWHLSVARVENARFALTDHAVGDEPVHLEVVVSNARAEFDRSGGGTLDVEIGAPGVLDALRASLRSERADGGTHASGTLEIDGLTAAVLAPYLADAGIEPSGTASTVRAALDVVSKGSRLEAVVDGVECAVGPASWLSIGRASFTSDGDVVSGEVAGLVVRGSAEPDATTVLGPVRLVPASGRTEAAEGATALPIEVTVDGKLAPLSLGNGTESSSFELALRAPGFVDGVDLAGNVRLGASELAAEAKLAVEGLRQGALETLRPDAGEAGRDARLELVASRRTLDDGGWSGRVELRDVDLDGEFGVGELVLDANATTTSVEGDVAAHGVRFAELQLENGDLAATFAAESKESGGTLRVDGLSFGEGESLAKVREISIDVPRADDEALEIARAVVLGVTAQARRREDGALEIAGLVLGAPPTDASTTDAATGATDATGSASATGTSSTPRASPGELAAPHARRDRGRTRTLRPRRRGDRERGRRHGEARVDGIRRAVRPGRCGVAARAPPRGERGTGTGLVRRRRDDRERRRRRRPRPHDRRERPRRRGLDLGLAAARGHARRRRRDRRLVPRARRRAPRRTADRTARLRPRATLVAVGDDRRRRTARAEGRRARARARTRRDAHHLARQRERADARRRPRGPGLAARVEKRAEGTDVAGLVLRAAPAEDAATPAESAEGAPPANGEKAAAPSTATSPAPAPGDGVLLDRLAWSGLRLDYVDRTVDPPVLLPIDELELDARNVAVGAQSRRPMTFRATLGGGEVELPDLPPETNLLFGIARDITGTTKRTSSTRPWLDELVVAGQISPEEPATGWVRTELVGFELTAIRGLGSASGVEIGAGTTDADVRVDLRGSKGMRIRSRTTFTSLSISEPADGPISRFLRLPAPLDVVLFALENERDEHVIPLEFSVREEGLSTSELVATGTEALVRLIADAIAASPLRLGNGVLGMVGLGGLFGGGDGKKPDFVLEVPFEVGRTGVEGATADAITEVLRKLEKDSKLVLRVQHRYSPQDLRLVEQIAVPAQEDCRALAQRLELDREDLVATLRNERERLARLVATGAKDDAAELTATLRESAATLANVERSLELLYELSGDLDDRAREKMVRAAALRLAERRYEALVRDLVARGAGDAVARLQLARPNVATVGEDGQPPALVFAPR